MPKARSVVAVVSPPMHCLREYFMQARKGVALWHQKACTADIVILIVKCVSGITLVSEFKCLGNQSLRCCVSEANERRVSRRKLAHGWNGHDHHMHARRVMLPKYCALMIVISTCTSEGLSMEATSSLELGAKSRQRYFSDTDMTHPKHFVKQGGAASWPQEPFFQ
eukprot:4022158-Amphidinium_carterae.1